MKYVSTFLILILVPFASILSQHNKPTTGKIPAWVSVNTIDFNAAALDKEAENGSVDLDYEKQINITNQSTYASRSIKILSEAGVQDNSNLTIDFDQLFSSSPSIQLPYCETMFLLINLIFRK